MKQHPARFAFSILLMTFVVISHAQTNSAIKLDEYGALTTDDEASHLDLFAERLSKEPKLKGQIVAYSGPRLERGYYLRRIYGINNYLINMRGIAADRLTVVDGGYAQEFSTALWLIPDGATSPPVASKMANPTVDTTKPIMFDQECLDCSPAVPLYLHGFQEGLKFYADALRERPSTTAVLIIRPNDRTSLKDSVQSARNVKSRLIKRHGITAQRITLKPGRYTRDGSSSIEMWIVPRRQ